MTRSLLHEAAFAFVRKRERYERLQARGSLDAATDAYAELQEMERCIHVTETSRAWREGSRR